MDQDRYRRNESVYSKKVRAGKRRTYFMDVKKTRGSDYYLTLTESTRRFNGDGYDRHKIFLYKEDFNRFLAGLEDVVNHVKTELMPDYDYDEYTRRHEEYEASLKAAAEETEISDEEPKDAGEVMEEIETELEKDDDLTW